MPAILGIDIGGSGIKGAPVNTETGELLSKRIRIPTPDKAKPKPMAEIVGEIANQFHWNGLIGCGFPAVIRGGVAFSAANIHESWLGTNAEKLFAEYTHCPTTVINDADAAGLAEMQFGAGKNLDRGVVLIITVGTGIGTALFVNRQLFPNTELGHIEIRSKDAEKRVSDAARQRKELSWEVWGGKFNEYLTTIERLMWPDVVIVGGGVSKQFDKFAKYLTLHAKIVPAELLNLAGIVGAALAVPSTITND